MDNASLKALLLRGLVAVKMGEKAQKDMAAGYEELTTGPSTIRIIVGLFASVTPRAIEAGVQLVESVAPLFEEVSFKVAVLQSALPALAEAIEKANEEKGVVSFGQLKEVVEEIKAEEEAKNPPKPKKAKKMRLEEMAS